MKLEDYIPYILYSDIPEAYQPVVDMIGMASFLKLCELSGGTTMYVPIADTIVRKTRNRMISQEYNGYNAKILSKKYGISEKQIKNVVKGE